MTSPPPALPIPVGLVAHERARQLLEAAERADLLDWLTNERPPVDLDGQRGYLLSVAGQRWLLRLDEVAGFVWGVAAGRGGDLVDQIRYRDDMDG